MPGPRVVIGAPLFNKARYLAPALESLLAQTFGDFAIVLIDDRSDDDTVAVARRYAEEDPRVHVVVNDRRLGMLGNTLEAWQRPRAMFPDAEFWALGSDHDLWHPRWMEELVGLLDAHPEAVMAYPQAQRIDEHGAPYATSKQPSTFSTIGIAGRRERMAAAFRGMSAGNMIYGLFRTSLLDELGHYRPVLVPDRLLLSEAALRGSFALAPEVLWQRRFRGLAELDRQRRAFFLDEIPRYAHLPWWVQHAGAFFLAYVIRVEGAAAGIGRAEGAVLTGDLLRLSLELRFRRRRGRVRRQVRRYAPRRLLGIARKRLLARFGPATGRWLRARFGALERRPATRQLGRWGLRRVDHVGDALVREARAKKDRVRTP